MRRLALPLALPLALLPILLTACDTLAGDDYEEQVIVSAVLVAGRALPPVLLTRTSPIEEPYDPETRRVDGAAVTISLLAPDGTVEEAFVYTQEASGLYGPQGPAAVLGGRRYRLEAAVPGQPEPLRAETTVPTAFDVVEPPPDTVAYQDPALPQGPGIRVTPSEFPRRQSVFLFTVRALAPDSFALDGEGNYVRQFLPGHFGLTPFAASFAADGDLDPADIVEGNSPLLNEANYERNADGTLTIRVPWLAVSYYGPQALTATALDDALVNFFQTQAIQFVPTTLSPGEIAEVVTNVENGLGVFGAVAQVENEVFVREP